MRKLDGRSTEPLALRRFESIVASARTVAKQRSESKNKSANNVCDQNKWDEDKTEKELTD